MSLDCFSDLDQVPEVLQEIHPGLFILPTGIRILLKSRSPDAGICFYLSRNYGNCPLGCGTNRPPAA
jgi:hypothetical protein